jgi:predicted nucleic acid-binding protein
MNDRVVVDASAVLAFLLDEDGADDVGSKLRTWRVSDVEILVPSPFWLEVSNSLLRRHRMNASRVIEAIHAIDEFGPSTVEVDRALVLLVIDRADRFGLTAYDAVYLALAEALDATLFTADRVLLAAAGSKGLQVVESQGHRSSERAAPYATPRRSTWPDYTEASAYLAKLRAEARAQA